MKNSKEEIIKYMLNNNWNLREEEDDEYIFYKKINKNNVEWSTLEEADLALEIDKRNTNSIKSD